MNRVLATGSRRDAVGPIATAPAWDAAMTRRRVIGTGLAVTLALTVLSRVRMRRHQVDLQVYRKGAWAFLHGRNLYGGGLPGPKLPYTYTPFSTVVFAPLSVLPLHAAILAHTVVSIAALFAGLALVLRELAGVRAGSRRWTTRVVGLAAAATFLAFWSEPVSQTLGFGQINLVLMALVLVDLLVIRDRRWGGVLIGIAAGIKLTPLVFVAYLVLTRRQRAALVAMASAGATVALGWVLMPGPSSRYFLHLVLDDRRIGAPGFVADQSLNGLWTRTVHGYAAARPFWDLSAIVVLAVGLWTARRIHQRLGEPYGLAIAAVTGLLVSPISWSHHWVWFTVPALCLGWTAWQRRSALVALLAAAWSVPFYVGPFWLIAHRNYRAVPPVGWQRPLADAYSLAALLGLAIVLIWDRATAPGEADVRPADRMSSAPHREGHAEASHEALISFGAPSGESHERSPAMVTNQLQPALGATLVVVPTLDEAANIDELLTRIRHALPAADVLVVDDGSLDGTPERAEHAAHVLGQISVWRRTGAPGLGAAYRAAFGAALDRAYEVVVQMDADLSHDPAQLTTLVRALEHGADVAIGSRYVPGGATPGWPARRRLLSRAGGTYARAVLALPVHDVTSGYRAYRADVLRAIDLGAVTSTGFGFQIDMTDRAARTGASIVEIPITFRDRTAGTSKMSRAIVGEALRLVTTRGLDRHTHQHPTPAAARVRTGAA